MARWCVISCTQCAVVPLQWVTASSSPCSAFALARVSLALPSSMPYRSPVVGAAPFPAPRLQCKLRRNAKPSETILRVYLQHLRHALCLGASPLTLVSALWWSRCCFWVPLGFRPHVLSPSHPPNMYRLCRRRPPGAGLISASWAGGGLR